MPNIQFSSIKIYRILLRCFWRFGSSAFLFGAVLKTINAASSFSQPLIMRFLLDYLQHPEKQKGREHWGYILAGIIFLIRNSFSLVVFFILAISQSYTIQFMYWVGFKDGLRVLSDSFKVT